METKCYLTDKPSSVTNMLYVATGHHRMFAIPISVTFRPSFSISILHMAQKTVIKQINIKSLKLIKYIIQCCRILREELTIIRQLKK
jgi:hypothetical protein